ncbi:hypothetical protein ANANG_G00292480 [Anguilla anguilla]|uniref:Uncharacterized protein n=1 Tax=Anguilla anguilla TaxID=7936 RepID=A0A9D3LKA7_ANGAN|nr:hypothetical protein ANANG_G00292480 [Anguilla anguilla]
MFVEIRFRCWDSFATLTTLTPDSQVFRVAILLGPEGGCVSRGSLGMLYPNPVLERAALVHFPPLTWGSLTHNWGRTSNRAPHLSGHQ